MLQYNRRRIWRFQTMCVCVWSRRCFLGGLVGGVVVFVRITCTDRQTDRQLAKLMPTNKLFACSCCCWWCCSGWSFIKIPKYKLEEFLFRVPRTKLKIPEVIRSKIIQHELHSRGEQSRAEHKKPWHFLALKPSGYCKTLGGNSTRRFEVGWCHCRW